MNLISVLILLAGPANPVHGVVHDWSQRPVAGARVSVSVDGKSVGETTTDARGEFTVEAPRGASVTVSKGDMYGSGVVRAKEITIVLRQMPM